MIDSGRHCTFKALLKKIRASLCLAQIRINRCDKHAATFNGMDSGAATSLPQLRPSSSVIAAKMALESSPALRFFRITVQSSFSRNPRGGEATAATARTAGTLADCETNRGELFRCRCQLRLSVWKRCRSQGLR